MNMMQMARHRLGLVRSNVLKSRRVLIKAWERASPPPLPVDCPNRAPAGTWPNEAAEIYS